MQGDGEPPGCYNFWEDQHRQGGACPTSRGNAKFWVAPAQNELYAAFKWTLCHNNTTLRSR